MTDRSPEKLARASGRKGVDASRNDDKQLRGYCDVTTTGFSPPAPVRLAYLLASSWIVSLVPAPRCWLQGS